MAVLRIRCLSLGLALITFALGLFTVSTVLSDDQITQWARHNAHVFATTTPRADQSDLASLRGIVGDAHIVGLGEGTHGTREFFQMKHRVVEYLVSEMGFHYFAIEASMPEAYQVNDYVLHGRGDPRALIRGMYFWTWNTKEVLDMVEWMRAFNGSGRGHIEFLGFDMQTRDTAEAIVSRFVSRANPAYADTVTSAWSMAERARPAAADSIGPRVSYADAQAAARRLMEYLGEHRERLGRATSPREVDWAIQNAHIVEQEMSMGGPGSLEATYKRDSCMALNVDWILAHAPRGARVVLWAHNIHVSRKHGYMGEHLTRRHGADYIALGSTTARGHFRALTSRGVPGDNALMPPAAGSLEEMLSATGLPRFLLDLRTARGNPAVEPWLEAEHPMRSIGSGAGGDQFRPTRVGRDFDAIVWVDSTSSSVPLPPR